MVKKSKNLTNIKDYNSKLSEEEFRKIRVKGGKASARKAKQRKQMKDVFIQLLDLPIKKGKAEKIEDLETVREKNITVTEAIALSQIKKAMKGDMYATEFILNMIGQSPLNQQTSAEQSSEFADAIKASTKAIKKVWKDEDS